MILSDYFSFRLFLLLLLPVNFGFAQDADRDGIVDRDEIILGTDPHHADVFTPIMEDAPETNAMQTSTKYDASKDILQVEFCHIGEDRSLWRITFSAPVNMKDTVLHLYIDADSDTATGRPGPPGGATTGTDYMLSFIGGKASSRVYDAKGKRTDGPHVNVVASAETLLISADLELTDTDDGLQYAMYVLCHSATDPGERPAMSDSLAKTQITGLPISDQKKIRRLKDFKDNHWVDATFDLEQIRKILIDPKNQVVPHDQLEREGFAIDSLTAQRFPHLTAQHTGARAWTSPPKPGTYYVGFMMNDDTDKEIVGILVDRKQQGVVVANRNDHRTWLYWLR